MTGAGFAVVVLLVAGYGALLHRAARADRARPPRPPAGRARSTVTPLRRPYDWQTRGE